MKSALPAGQVPDDPIDPILEVIEELEPKLVPESEDLDALVMTALRMYTPQLASRGRALIGRWRATGCTDPDLDLAEGLLAVAGASASAQHRLRGMGDLSSQQAAAEAVGQLFRGEIRASLDLARAHGWFLDEPELTEPLGLVLVGAAMEGLVDEAEVVVRAWQRRWYRMSPEKVVSALQCEARLAYFQQQYGRELAVLQDAWSLAGKSGLSAARMFIEPALTGAYVHCGEFEEALRIMEGWDPPDEAMSSPLQGIRDMVRVDVALLEGRHEDAWSAAGRYLRFGEAMQNVVLIAEGRFYRTISAPGRCFEWELDAYRRLAYRFQLKRHLNRLRIVERLVRAGSSHLRDAAVQVTDRVGAQRHPIVRLWLPRVEWVGADLFVDRVRGRVHLQGTGPYDLATRRVLQRLLDAILARPDLAIRLEDLFVEVWGAPYDPLLHEGRVHVNIHRLRSWLRERCPDGTSLLEVVEGVVRLPPDADVRIAELGDCCVAAGGETSTRERLLQCLAGTDPLAPGVLERRLGVSRSLVNRTLRVLLAEGRVARLGAGRATRYVSTGGQSA